LTRLDILIVGGGQAARRAAEGARAVSNDLSIGILGEELHTPYERPPLSKAALIEGASACPAPGADHYEALRIDLMLGRRAGALDRARRRVVTEDGDSIEYGRLILATGSRPRGLPVPPGLDGRVCLLRTREDAERLAAGLTPGARVAIIGAGFIGLEVASSALALGARPTVIEAGGRILARGLPRAPADRLLALHRAAGVEVLLETAVEGFECAQDGAVALRLGAETRLFELVVVGIGVRPNIELAEAAGLDVSDGLLVDDRGATSDPDVFGAGEVTRHPVSGAEAAMRLESWQVAELQAEAAGRAAAGQGAPHRIAPWFWTDQAGANVQVLGHIGQGPLIERDYGEGVVSYFSLDEGGRLTGMATINAGRDISAGRRLLAHPGTLEAGPLEDPSVPLRRLLS
jgi:anthranilate 1,2-dioxygenase ferredoxin reductase component